MDNTFYHIFIYFVMFELKDGYFCYKIENLQICRKMGTQIVFSSFFEVFKFFCDIKFFKYKIKAKFGWIHIWEKGHYKGDECY